MVLPEGASPAPQPTSVRLQANIKFFGRHKGGFIRDGVLLGLR